MKTSDFDPITPGATEWFTHDFADVLASGEQIVGNPVWVVSVAEHSTVADAAAATRLIGTAQVEGQKTRHQIGNCVAGVIYLVEATVDTSFGSDIPQWCYLPCEVVR